MGPTPLRPAGLIESWHITRHFLGLDSCVLEHLFAALHKVIEQHPILSVMVQTRNPSRRSPGSRKIELPLVVQFSDNNDLEAAIQRQLATRLIPAAELPLWLILAYHHGIGDGLSGVAFHRSLLAALQDVGDASGSLVVHVSESLSLLPPIEAVTNVWPSLRKIITEVFSLLLPASGSAATYAWNANSVSKNARVHPPMSNSSRSRAKKWPRFAKICRLHNATVTSAFYVLAAAILSRLTLTARPADAFCDYVSGHMSTPPINPAFQWPARPRATPAELQRQKTAVRQEIGMIYLIASNIAGFMKGCSGASAARRLRSRTRGACPRSRVRGRGASRRMVFAQSDLVVGAALKINVTGDPTGAVTVALTWGEAAIDGEVVESFTTQFQEGLRALLV
ncbi:hypothetical protein B0H14DRAFT_2928703 [Mycena olivaceomarginata]|nr:hypothetical protein B0H14DRAFT_2928703 [Mycena olivaceomarginata]